MLGLFGFLGVCLLAALFPTLTAYVIFGVAAFYAVDTYRQCAKNRTGRKHR